MRPARLRYVNALTLLLVLALNGAAATGAMSGDSIGVLANRYRSLFLPADWTFSIWSVIYLGLIGSAAFQLTPARGAAESVARLGPWWAITGALNVAWITLFSFGRFGLALLVMVAFLAALVVVGARLRAAGAPDTWATRAFVRWPFDVYLAWISVALISNSFQYAHVVQWGGAGIAESTWAVAMMGVAALLAVAMAWGWRAWAFPLVVAWALYGIGARHATLPAIAEATAWLIPGVLVAGLGAYAVRRRA